MILANNILANFMSSLNSNILMLLYDLALINLDEIIMKMKMIEIGQKNTLETI